MCGPPCGECHLKEECLGIKAPDDRWYKGKRHCIITNLVPFGKAIKEQYRVVKFDDGKYDTADVRTLWRQKKSS